MTRIEQFACAAMAGLMAYAPEGQQPGGDMCCDWAWVAADRMEAEAMRRDAAAAAQEPKEPTDAP